MTSVRAKLFECRASLVAMAAGLILCTGMTQLTNAALVTVSSPETWNGIANPHAADGVTLSTETIGGTTFQVYTIPAGMMIGNAGRIDLANANIALRFPTGSGNLLLDGQVNLYSTYRDFGDPAKTLLLQMNGNSLAGAGDFVHSVPGQFVHNLAIEDATHVGFDDFLTTKNDALGGGLTISASGTVAIDNIDTRDTSTGGNSSPGVTIQAQRVHLGGSVLTGSGRTSGGSGGAISVTALKYPGFDPGDGAANSLGNVVAAYNRIDTWESPGTSPAAVALQGVQVKLGAAAAIDDGSLVPSIFAGDGASQGIPPGALFVDQSGGGLSATHSVQFQASATLLETRSQTFDSPLGALAGGWVSVNTDDDGNHYGFSATNNTGGTPGGEAGGTIARSGALSFYADTSVGSLGLSDSLSASGELDLTGSSNFNNNIRIGYFRSTEASYRNALGLAVAEPASGSNYRVLAQLALANGLQVGGNILTFTPNGDYTWSLAWDPTGGVDDPSDVDLLGEGLLTASLFNSSGGWIGDSTVDLTAAQRMIGIVGFDAFGLGSGGIGSPGVSNTANVFIDNLRYTVAAVPEPDSLVLMAGAGVLLAWAAAKPRGAKARSKP